MYSATALTALLVYCAICLPGISAVPVIEGRDGGVERIADSFGPSHNDQLSGLNASRPVGSPQEDSANLHLDWQVTDPVTPALLISTLGHAREFVDRHIQEFGDGLLYPQDDPFDWIVTGQPDEHYVKLHVESNVARHRLKWSELQLTLKLLAGDTVDLHVYILCDFTVENLLNVEVGRGSLTLEHKVGSSNGSYGVLAGNFTLPTGTGHFSSKPVGTS